ncbi:MAG: transcription antitermination factor NusB [Lentisphaeria bacterium]|nr:transcription antitermination factor NusB [Lentisphaeria bacterium]MBR7127476.1 transcription antitermination factor NusB [Lentisphaeria bacterium]
MFEESDLEVKNTKLHSKRLARELAMQYLFSCDIASELPDVGKFEEFYEESLKNEHNLSDNRYSRKSKEAAEELIVNVALNADVIDDKIREFAANWQWDRISVVERNILRIAVYEMLFALDVPPIVSINEAVSIARDYSNERSCNFINGILNSIKDTLDRDGRTGAKK